MSALPVGSFVGNDSVGVVEGPWDDLQGDISLGDAVANPTYEAFRDTPFKMYWFRHDQSDELHFRFQTRHSWARGELRFHLHLVPGADVATAKNVRFAGQYAWAVYGQEIPANVSWTPFTANMAVLPGDVNTEKIAPIFTATPPAGATESSILLVFLYRDSGAADTYTESKGYGTAAANLGILAADCHFQGNKDGTATEYPTS